MWELVLICVGVEKKRIMYQLKVDVDKLNAVKVVVSWRFERWPFVGARQEQGLLRRRANARNVSSQPLSRR